MNQYACYYMQRNTFVWVNIDLRLFLHIHGNIATEWSSKLGLLSSDFKGSLKRTVP